MNHSETIPTFKDRLRGELEPFLKNLGYSIYELELGNVGKRMMVRVFLDSEHPIGLGDCEVVSRALSDYFDEHDDLIRTAFNLEVSSPGIFRELRTPDDYRRFAGHRIKIIFQEGISSPLTGTLSEYGEGIVKIMEEKSKSIREFPLGEIKKVNLAPKI